MKENQEYSIENYEKIEKYLEEISYNEEVDKDTMIRRFKRKMKEWEISGPDKDLKGFLKELVVTLVMDL